MQLNLVIVRSEHPASSESRSVSDGWPIRAHVYLWGLIAAMQQLTVLSLVQSSHPLHNKAIMSNQEYCLPGNRLCLYGEVAGSNVIYTVHSAASG